MAETNNSEIGVSEHGDSSAHSLLCYVEQIIFYRIGGASTLGPRLTLLLSGSSLSERPS